MATAIPASSMRSGAPASPWWIVGASFSALLLGAGTLTYVFGVVLRPVTEELGISRGVFSTGMLVFAIMAALACPFIGGLVDRWSPRKVLLPFIACFALCLVGVSMMTASPALIWLLFGACGLTAVGLTPVPYARIISTRFQRHRGLALGITVAAVGCGLAIAPIVAGSIIATSGWRSAFMAYAVGVIVLAFVPVALLLKHTGSEAEASARTAKQQLAGMDAPEAVRTWRFWALLVAFFLGVVAVIGTISHTVPMLIDRGLPMKQAASVISMVGLSAIVARVVCGWLLDRLSGPLLAVVFFIVPAVGIMIMASGLGGAWPYVGAALLGVAVGSEVDLLAYFVGGYFGLRAFGKIYGFLFAAFSLGSGVGPFLSGVAFDHFRSYHQIFVVYEFMLLAAILLVMRLGPYAYLPRHGRAGAGH